MNDIHDTSAQLHIFSALESEGKSTTFLTVCFAVPGVKPFTVTTKDCRPQSKHGGQKKI